MYTLNRNKVYLSNVNLIKINSIILLQILNTNNLNPHTQTCVQMYCSLPERRANKDLCLYVCRCINSRTDIGIMWMKSLCECVNTFKHWLTFWYKARDLNIYFALIFNTRRTKYNIYVCAYLNTHQFVYIT